MSNSIKDAAGTVIVPGSLVSHAVLSRSSIYWRHGVVFNVLPNKPMSVDLMSKPERFYKIDFDNLFHRQKVYPKNLVVRGQVGIDNWKREALESFVEQYQEYWKGRVAKGLSTPPDYADNISRLTSMAQHGILL